MKINSFFAGLTAIGLMVAPVVVQAGTRTSSVGAVAGVSALPAVRPALTQEGQRRASPVRRAEGALTSVWIPIIVAGVLVGGYFAFIDDSSGS